MTSQKNSKLNIIINTVLGKISSIIGWTIATFFTIIIIIGVGSVDKKLDRATLVFCFICISIGVLFIMLGSRTKRRIKRFKKYLLIISTKGDTSIENIAGSTSQSIDFVIKDIEIMIKKKYFSNAYIDLGAKKIIFRDELVVNNSNCYNNLSNESVFNNSKSSKWLSKPRIFIVLILCWPLGLYLLWKRTEIDDNLNLMSIDRSIQITGWICIVLSILWLILQLSYTDVTVLGIMLTLTIIDGLGIGLIVIGNKRQKRTKKYKTYIDLIINQQMTSIDNIANFMSITYHVAKNDLNNMIDKGYFVNAYINEANREVTFLKKQHTVHKKENFINVNDANCEMTVITCKACGLNNHIIKGAIGECKFCGSAINGI